MATSTIKGLPRIIRHESGSKSVPSGGSVTYFFNEFQYADANSGLYLICAKIACGIATAKANDLQLRLYESSTGGVIEKTTTDSSIGNSAIIIVTGGRVSLGSFQTTGNAVTISYDFWVIQLA